MLLGKGEIGNLTNGNNDCIAIELGQICFIILRVEGAIFVEYTGAALEFNSREPPVAVQESVGAEAVNNLNALF